MVSLPDAELVVFWLKQGNRIHEVDVSRVQYAILL